MDSKRSAGWRSAGWLIAATAALVVFAAAFTVFVSRRAERNRLSIQLMRALAQGDAETALIALDRGADPNANALLLLDSRPQSLREQILTLFHRPQPDPDRAGTTALLVAMEPDVLSSLPPNWARAGRRIPPSAPTSLIRALLERGARPNTRGPAGVTPLYEAALPIRPDVIRLLLDHGANPNVTPAGGETPLMLASCRAGSQSVRDLLAHGADPNTRDSHGMTALMWAAYRGDVEPAQDLMAHGADPNARDPRGKTPLMMMAMDGSWADPPSGEALVRALLTRGADPSLRDHVGQTALMQAEKPVARRVLVRLLQSSARRDEVPSATRMH